MCKNPIMKRINHFIREKTTDGSVKIDWVNTQNQIADIFTKPLGLNLFRRFRNLLLGIISGHSNPDSPN